MGGSPDWMHDDERKHYVDTAEERWADGKWSDHISDVKKVQWLNPKVGGVYPPIPEGCIEAICFDDDLMDTRFNLSVRIYNGVWSKPMRFSGKDIPYIKEGTV